MTLRQSPLRAEHDALGARLVAFGGWEMPLSYPTGTIAEHLACRHGAVAFDVSHLGTVRLGGPGAFESLQAALTNDLTRIAPGRAQYTHLLDPSDASVLDDIIVWWVAPDRFDVMPNASNTAGVRSAVGGEDVTADRAVIAVQGPTARQVAAAVSPVASAVGRFQVLRFDFEDVECVAAGTGYTGEDGLECAIPAEHAASFWRQVVAAGAVPAGLGARDTLRLESGLPLHGHELGPGITPLQANLGWVIGWDKGDFRGRAALEAERSSGPRRILRGVLAGGRRPLRDRWPILVEGEAVGELTSGNYSPVLERGIGLGFVPPATPDGQQVTLDAGGPAVSATVVKPPFQRLAAQPGGGA